MIFLKNKKVIMLLCGWLCVNIALCQSIESQIENPELSLGKEYLRVGDYEKAKVTLQKIVKNNREAYKPYLQCLVQLKELEEAEKFVKRQLKNDERNINYKLDLADISEQRGKTEEAEKNYQEAIALAAPEETTTNLLINELFTRNQFERALVAIETSRKTRKDQNLYALSAARLRKLLGQIDGMIEEYLNFGRTEGYIDLAQSFLQDELKDEKQQLRFEKILYKKIQDATEDKYYSEMLIWYFVQQKEFYKAFVQARAIDKRFKQEGQKVAELGFMAVQNKEYEPAGKIFDYLVKEYAQSPNYPTYRRLLINAKEEIIKTTYPVNQEDIRVLVREYRKFFNETKQPQKAQEALKSIASLHAFYLNEKDSAITWLEQALRVGQGDRDFTDRCKLDMGDVYLLKNEPWEATLLYSQVEKSQKEGTLGFDAKLRNAKLAYYKGDFDLAKEVLDILKKATTREIANDALDLALLIQDNTGMDTSETAMREYAAADLLLYQNRTQEALSELNRLFTKYKNHPLADEILWTRAKTLLKENRNEEALADLEKIIATYSIDILGDDALFLASKVYQDKMNNPDKAMKGYQELLKKYPGSIHNSEARKRFRKLRGDTIN